jgi:hypothetical protein
MRCDNQGLSVWVGGWVGGWVSLCVCAYVCMCVCRFVWHRRRLRIDVTFLCVSPLFVCVTHIWYCLSLADHIFVVTAVRRVQAKDRVDVLILDRDTFREYLCAPVLDKREQFQRILQRVELFSNMTRYATALLHPVNVIFIVLLLLL